jgi:CHAT domain-containing protein
LNGKSQEININAQQYAAMATDIYTQLFPKLPPQFKDCQELIIAPDRILNTLPFEALVETSQTAVSNFKDLPYLVRHFPITYIPSWKIYAMNKAVTLPQKPTLRAYTYDFSSNELPSAKAEKVELTRIFGQNASFAIGKECSKQRFLADTNGHFDILHFSLHAESNPLSKQDNKIYFAPKHGDIVYGFDLLKRRFSEKLVFISSCESAYGKIAKGEGAYTLSRSIMRAGASSVVASLWSISDETTGKITTQFYENIFVKHQTPSLALYNAKLSYLKTADSYTAQPHLWAGLVCWD